MSFAEPTPDLDAALRALADGNRRTILHVVRDGPCAVGEIAERAGLSQQTASHHLKVLRSAGLVSEQRDGTRRLYAVRTDGLAAVRSYLDGFWPAKLDALKRAAEAAARAAPGGGDG
ncbi:ArsR/SmtB family transcription factor [Yinghuangia soli]|uniref:Metalloregulator ArsR/SmtB family transcription factor n=1 Tax=Yinghuangia soli TaxID=2908204 RepID=A0AA41PX39_9ACTN|nr:metalloregulator ArsR/SmtB family transcription factor [Yinghuangia soli]MCF2527343.1 metalloregulator ArsR/SmtB family transcription factor [Yinghuangia soli]